MASLHLRSMEEFRIIVQGPSASVAQRSVEGPGCLKAKGIVLGIIIFSKNDTDTASFCRFRNSRSHRHDSVARRSLCFCSAQAAVNSVGMEFVKSLDLAIFKFQGQSFQSLFSRFKI